MTYPERLSGKTARGSSHSSASRSPPPPFRAFFPAQDERCVEAVVAALAPLAGPEARRLAAARSRPAVLLHGPATAESGGGLVEAAAERVGCACLPETSLLLVVVSLPPSSVVAPCLVTQAFFFSSLPGFVLCSPPRLLRFLAPGRRPFWPHASRVSPSRGFSVGFLACVDPPALSGPQPGVPSRDSLPAYTLSFLEPLFRAFLRAPDGGRSAWPRSRHFAGARQRHSVAPTPLSQLLSTAAAPRISPPALISGCDRESAWIYACG